MPVRPDVVYRAFTNWFLPMAVGAADSSGAGVGRANRARGLGADIAPRRLDGIAKIADRGQHGKRDQRQDYRVLHRGSRALIPGQLGQKC